MITKVFLTVVGVAYLGLAAWCIVKPAQTSNAVGFTLQPGSGQSEYFTAYGGLQLALGIAFLWPLVQSDSQRFALLLCLIVHGCLVVLRGVSFTLYSGIQSITYGFAASELVVCLLAAWRVFAEK